MSDILPEAHPASSPPRIMRPDDANVAGNVHGGTVLKMIEEAGAIISTRHCNSQNGVGIWGPSASLARSLGDPGSPLQPCCTLWVQDRSLGGAWAWGLPLPLPWALGASRSPGPGPGTLWIGTWFGAH